MPCLDTTVDSGCMVSRSVEIEDMARTCRRPPCLMFLRGKIPRERGGREGGSEEGERERGSVDVQFFAALFLPLFDDRSELYPEIIAVEPLLP